MPEIVTETLPEALRDGRITVTSVDRRHYFYSVEFKTYLGATVLDFMAAEVPGGFLITPVGPSFVAWTKAEDTDQILEHSWQLARRITAGRHPGDIHQQVIANYEEAII